MRTLTLFLAAALSAILLLSSCGPAAVESQPPSAPPSPTATPEPSPTPEPVPATPAPVAIEITSYLDAGYPDGYEELTESQKLLYDAMLDVLKDIIANGYVPQKTYPLGGSVTYEESSPVENLFCANFIVLRDIISWFGMGDHSGPAFDEIGLIDYDCNAYRDQYLELEAAAEKILSGLTYDGTEYGKAMAIARWLAENVPYAHDYAERPEDWWWLSSAYGPLIKGEAVCSGYAQAYALLCKKAGLEVLYLEGPTLREDHAWNMVRVGENWYHVDTTWMADDRNLLRYFMMTDEVCRSTGHLEWTVPGVKLTDTVEPPVADHDDLYETEYRCSFETAEQALAFFESASGINFMSYRLMFGSYEEQQKFYQLTETVITNREGDYYMLLVPLEDDSLSASFYDASGITFEEDEP